MDEIEKHLHAVHAEGGLVSQTESMDFETTPDTPIAKVTSVTAGSPADEAVCVDFIDLQSKFVLFVSFSFFQGLKSDDLITNFGSVNSSNFNSLNDIANIVKHSINQMIKVIVLRNETTSKIYLKPHSWSGPGMLGCVILPFENVER